MKKFLPLVLVCFLSTYVIEAKSFSSKTVPKIFKHFITLIISPQIYKKISRIAFFLRCFLFVIAYKNCKVPKNGL